MKNTKQNLHRSKIALDGLSVGDSLGQKFFIDDDEAIKKVKNRELPESPWYLTDDSIMGIAIFETLERFGFIDQDFLAQKFGENYTKSPHRGYGATAHEVLRRIHSGENWKDVSESIFDGQGSHGNGSAMRVAPIGAYFSNDVPLLLDEAKKSAVVTHSNPEGIAGAQASALATAWSCLFPKLEINPTANQLFDFVLDNLPPSDTNDRIQKARRLSRTYTIQTATAVLGNGMGMSAMDTIPLCLWLVTKYGNNFADTIWYTILALGDRDTTSAIVGGIMANREVGEGIPSSWIESRECLIEWEGGNAPW